MADPFLEADLPARDGDEELTPAQLAQLSFFEGLAVCKELDRFPGAIVLRRYRQGEVVFRQAEAGHTAFVILRTEDVLRLRQGQLSAADGNANEQTLAEWREEVRQCETRLAELAADPRRDSPGRNVAIARLSVPTPTSAPKRSFWRRWDKPHPQPTLPSFVPNDGPADIDMTTRSAAFFEGDLFGEMSCIDHAPRSATVVVLRDCYMIEMLRNILDKVRADEAFRRESDESYRRRVLDGHLGRLEIFASLSKDDLQFVREHCELLMYEPGSVLFHEHDPTDAVYIVRSGVAKVIQNTGWRLNTERISLHQARIIAYELLANRDSLSGLLRRACQQLDAPVWGTAARLASGEGTDADRLSLVDGLNRALSASWRPEKFGSDLESLLEKEESPELVELIEALPSAVNRWSEADICEFTHGLLSALSPKGLSPRAVGTRRILGYFGRGEVLGEIGLITGKPRSATCIAFNHPDHEQSVTRNKGVTPSRIEVVRIKRADFEELLRRSSGLKDKVEQLAKRRLAADAAPQRPENALRSDPEFERLGLYQGQALMLIDLNACTRCGDCVRACVNTHADGHSRLYLDGQRAFGRYLTPISCRACLDPVCMIGCPVSSIVKGDKGEIEIKSWCIGCEKCANQCPYGSIHMHSLATGESSDEAPATRAVVCDLCSSSPIGPACIYHCPHDAAMRVDALAEFPGVG